MELELLLDEIRHLNEEIKDAHDILNEMKVPTNGLDAKGNPGLGKREVLTLKQRISFLTD